jgi:hypothetical protein
MRDNRKSLQKAIKDSLKIGELAEPWASKGIYIWYWRGAAGSKAWPLYVGKSQRPGSSFGSRTIAHTRNALSGRDFLYSPELSRNSGSLVPLYNPVTQKIDHISGDSAHVEKAIAQFSELSVLLLPMETGAADRVAHQAEGVVLQSVLLIHEQDSGSGTGYDLVMNSPSKAHNAEHLRPRLGLLTRKLREWLSDTWSKSTLP